MMNYFQDSVHFAASDIEVVDGKIDCIRSRKCHVSKRAKLRQQKWVVRELHAQGAAVKEREENPRHA